MSTNLQAPLLVNQEHAFCYRKRNPQLQELLVEELNFDLIRDDVEMLLSFVDKVVRIVIVQLKYAADSAHTGVRYSELP